MKFRRIFARNAIVDTRAWKLRETTSGRLSLMFARRSIGYRSTDTAYRCTRLTGASGSEKSARAFEKLAFRWPRDGPFEPILEHAWLAILVQSGSLIPRHASNSECRPSECSARTEVESTLRIVERLGRFRNRKDQVPLPVNSIIFLRISEWKLRVCPQSFWFQPETSIRSTRPVTRYRQLLTRGVTDDRVKDSPRLPHS